MSTTKLPSENPLLTLTREPQSCLWVIEMHNGEDNRLTHDHINRALKPALDIVEREWRETWRAAQAGKATSSDGRGALIITGKRTQDKFFSNGLDLPNAMKDYNFFHETFGPLLTRVLAFPIPVVAALNGHAFAGGFALAIACDYRVMTDGKERRAWCCLNEVHFGSPLPTAMAVLIRAKFPDVRTLRRLALEGYRFTPQEALDAGLIDLVADGGSSEAVFSAAQKLALEKAELAKSGVWGLIKKNLYRDTLEGMAKDHRPIMALHEDASARARL